MDSTGGQWGERKSGCRAHARCNEWVESRRHNIGWLREHVGHCDMTGGALGSNGSWRIRLDEGD